MRETAVSPIGLSRVDEAARELVERGFTALERSIDRLVQPVLAGWLAFLEKPQEEKDQFTIQTLFTDPKEGPDDGYFYRNGAPIENGAGHYDPLKETFHYKKHLLSELRKQGVSPSDQELEWIRACRSLWLECRKLTLKLSVGLDQVLPGYDFQRRFCHPKAERAHVLRLLRYGKAAMLGQELGKLHPDRNHITLHLAESTAGCIIHDGDSESLYRAKPGVVLAFPGRKTQLHTGGYRTSQMGNSKPVLRGGKVQATKHRVSVIDPKDLEHERWSMVFFSHIHIDDAL